MWMSHDCAFKINQDFPDKCDEYGHDGEDKCEVEIEDEHDKKCEDVYEAEDSQ